MSRIILTKGTAKAEIETTGGEIISCKTSNGRELLWQGNPDVWEQHAPVLFPVCGRSIGGKVAIGGREYSMTPHGFCKNAEFSVTAAGDDSAELTLMATAETRTMYPFDFAFHVKYTLEGKGYSTKFSVENLSENSMPFCWGGHPGINVPMEQGASFEDYQLIFEKIEDGRNMLVKTGGFMDGFEYIPGFHNTDKLTLQHSLFDTRDTLVFTELASRSVKLVNKNTDRGVKIDFQGFPVLAVWTMPGKSADYVCIEPWKGLPSVIGETGNLEDRPFVTILKPGEKYESTFTIREV